MDISYRFSRWTILVFLFHFSHQVLDAQSSEKLTTGPANGHLIIAGGGLRDTSVFNLFIRLAGGPTAPVVIIPTAADDEFFERDGVGVHIDL